MTRKLAIDNEHKSFFKKKTILKQNKFKSQNPRISTAFSCNANFDACECSISKCSPSAGNSVLSGFSGNTIATVELYDNAGAATVTQIGFAGKINLEKWYVDFINDSNKTRVVYIGVLCS